MWEFFSHLVDTAAGQIAVFVLLAIAVVAVVQFVRGDWKLVRTKEGKVIFTTAQQRTSYDTSNGALKLIRQHIAADDKRYEELLKLTFYSDEIRRIRPCESLRAGIKYVKTGGNGEVKEDVLAYCKEHGELYRGLQAGSAVYHLDELKIGVDV